MKAVLFISPVGWRRNEEKIEECLIYSFGTVSLHKHTRERVAKTANKVHIFHFSQQETSRLKCTCSGRSSVWSMVRWNGFEATNVRFRITDERLFLTFAAPCLFLPTHSRDLTQDAFRFQSRIGNSKYYSLVCWPRNSGIFRNCVSFENVLVILGI